MKLIRALALDLDRTLLRDDRTISAYTREVMKRCAGLGVKRIIATARPLRAVREYQAVIGAEALITLIVISIPAVSRALVQVRRLARGEAH